MGVLYCSPSSSGGARVCARAGPRERAGGNGSGCTPLAVTQMLFGLSCAVRPDESHRPGTAHPLSRGRMGDGVTDRGIVPPAVRGGERRAEKPRARKGWWPRKREGGGKGGNCILSARSFSALPGSTCPGLEWLLLSCSSHCRWQAALPESSRCAAVCSPDHSKVPLQIFRPNRGDFWNRSWGGRGAASPCHTVATGACRPVWKTASSIPEPGYKEIPTFLPFFAI